MSIAAPVGPSSATALSWFGVFRAGLVQTAIGAIVVLATSTMNRVMVVELTLPAMLPGILVALHYGVQILRPRLGYGSDVGGRRTPWIVGGMAVLAIGGVGAAAATALMSAHLVAGIALAVLAFVLIGIGVGAAGTSLLVLLATSVAPRRRAAAATIVWLMMILGIVVTATLAGHFLDPFSFARLVVVSAAVAASAFAVALLGLWRLERSAPGGGVRAREPHPPFRRALAQVWAEPRSRRFAIFVFLSMVAYSMQDLVLEPFAGAVFDYTPGASTQLAGLQHAGVFAGMILVAIAVSGFGDRRGAALRAWTVGGCVASCVAIAALAAAALAGPGWPLKATVFALGAANGVYAVAAIGSMMQFVGEGMAAREGVRMGLWGAAQAIAFAVGGLLGTVIADVFHRFTGSAAQSYAVVFAAEGLLFLAAAVLAARLDSPAALEPSPMAGKLNTARVPG